jgi:hypothetical protein
MLGREALLSRGASRSPGSSPHRGGSKALAPERLRASNGLDRLWLDRQGRKAGGDCLSRTRTSCCTSSSRREPMSSTSASELSTPDPTLKSSLERAALGLSLCSSRREEDEIIDRPPKAGA